MSLIPNDQDFTFSVISRADGVAVMSGSLRLHPHGLYKIEAFMDTNLEVALAIDSDDGVDAGV